MILEQSSLIDILVESFRAFKLTLFGFLVAGDSVIFCPSYNLVTFQSFNCWFPLSRQGYNGNFCLFSVIWIVGKLNWAYGWYFETKFCQKIARSLVARKPNEVWRKHINTKALESALINTKVLIKVRRQSSRR